MSEHFVFTGWEAIDLSMQQIPNMIKHKDGTTGIPRLFDKDGQPTERFTHMKKLVSDFWIDEKNIMRAFYQANPQYLPRRTSPRKTQ